MEYQLIHSQPLIKRITRKDELFHGVYCIDSYQNCEFGCLYCDSSLEKKIFIKANVVELLKKELNGLQKGRIIIGSVHDPYQNAEKQYELTKNILTTLLDYGFPCHILTKSPLILRDLDLLSELDCIVTISLTSLDQQVLNIFEPNVPSPQHRLNAVHELRTNAIYSGIALMPLLPFIVESELEAIIKAAQEVEAQYILHKHLELKGDQKRLFHDSIAAYYPQVLPKYTELFKDDYKPGIKYCAELNKLLSQTCKKYKMPDKIRIKH